MNKLRRIFKKAAWQMTPEGVYVPIPEETESYLYGGPIAEAVAFPFQPPSVIPGVLTRPYAPNDVITKVFGATAFTAYGLPAKLSGSNTVIPIANTADAVYGVLVRPFPRQPLTTTDQGTLYAGTPPTAGPADILRKGYIGVFCRNGVPAEGGQVYIRFQNPTGSKIVGGFEATNTADVYALTGWTFTGVADANGNAEIQSP
jgi:hypothetical protein